MTLSLAAIPNPESSLARRDPRWRVAALLLAATVSAFVQTLPAAGASLTLALVLALFARMPWNWYARRLAAMLPFFLLFVGLLPFLVRDPEPLFSIGPVPISAKGLRLGALIACKALAVATCILVVLITAPMQVTLHAAHRLHLPGLAVQLALLTYRYLFVFAQELSRVRIALRVRGFRRRVSVHNYRTVAHVVGALLVHSHDRAERIGQAMRCRGFDGQFRSLATFRTSGLDVFMFLVVTLCATSLVLLDYFPY